MTTVQVFNSDQFKQPEAIAFAAEVEQEVAFVGMMKILLRVQERLLLATESAQLAAELVVIKWWILGILTQGTRDSASSAMQFLGAERVSDDEPKQPEGVLN